MTAYTAVVVHGATLDDLDDIEQALVGSTIEGTEASESTGNVGAVRIEDVWLYAVYEDRLIIEVVTMNEEGQPGPVGVGPIRAAVAGALSWPTAAVRRPPEKSEPAQRAKPIQRERERTQWDRTERRQHLGNPDRFREDVDRDIQFIVKGTATYPDTIKGRLERALTLSRDLMTADQVAAIEGLVDL